MSQFLRDSTFAIRDVFFKSFFILKNHYFSVAILCLLMFLVSNASSGLAGYINHVNDVLSGFLATCFFVLYTGVNLTLSKVILAIIDNKENKKLKDMIPSTKELLSFIAAMLIVIISALGILFCISLLCLPLIYLHIKVETMVSFVLIVSFLITFLFIIRVAFYPFFIIDKGEKSMEAVRLSFSMTRGNVFKLLAIMAVFAFMHALQFYTSIWLSFFVGLFFGAINAFIVVPLSTVVITVAYREMITGVKKEESLNIFKNII